MDTEKTYPEFIENSICPVSGLNVLARREWQNVRFNEDSTYTISVKCLGERILFVRTGGHGSMEDMKAALEFTRRIVEDHLVAGVKYVRIEDLNEFVGISSDARAFYASVMAHKEPLDGLIYFNVPPLLRTSIYLGMKFGLVPFKVKMVNSYNEAMLLAQHLLKEAGG